MTFRWILPALVAASAGILAFGVTQRIAWRTNHSELDALRDITVLARTLDLREEQAREIEILHNELSVRLKDCCDRHCSARLNLGRALTGDAADDARVDDLVSEMCLAYAESERLMLEHIRRVRDVLDMDQRQRFNEMVIDALSCQHCPVCEKTKADARPETYEHHHHH